jgi:DNA-binding response OmpR family regulator
MDRTPRVLVVDDDADILDALTFMLEDDGYDVITSEKVDVAEALPVTDGPLPDLIILDVLLSGRDGRVVCQKLKSEPRTQDVPVLMISAHPGAEQSVLQAGANAFLAKPFSIDDFLNKVADLIGPEKRVS